MKNKKVLIGINIVLILALSAAIVFGALWFSGVLNKQNSSSLLTVEDEKGNHLNDGQAHELPDELHFKAASPMVWSASPNGTALASVILTATVNPAAAENKKVDWTIFWAEDGATGEVTDFVNVIPEGDGALKAKVECYAAFDYGIVIMVTTREGGKTAMCQVKFTGRLTTLSVTGYQNLPSKTSSWAGQSPAIAYKINATIKNYEFPIVMDNPFHDVRDYQLRIKEIRYAGGFTGRSGNYLIGMSGSAWQSGKWPDGTANPLVDTYVNFNDMHEAIVDVTIDGMTLKVTVKQSIQNYYEKLEYNDSRLKSYRNKWYSGGDDCVVVIIVGDSVTGGTSTTVPLVISSGVENVSLNQGVLFW